jgi:hypothetical protein
LLILRPIRRFKHRKDGEVAGDLKIKPQPLHTSFTNAGRRRIFALKIKVMEKGKKAGKKPDYIKIRHAAYEYVVVQGKSQKEVAALLGISEKTMSGWAAKGKWLELRKSRQSSVSISGENLRQLIGLLSERRLSIEHRINDAIAAGQADEVIALRKEASGLSAEMAFQNKALSNINREDIALGVYVDVLDDIFTALRAYDPDLFEKTIEFQTLHLRRKSNELG